MLMVTYWSKICILYRKLQTFIDSSKDICPDLNAEKTKYMLMSCEETAGQNNIKKMGNKSTERVGELKYLGTAPTNQNCNREGIKCRLNSGHVCYCSVQNRLSASLLSKNIKIEIYRTIISTVVLYGYETLSFTLKEKHRPRMLKKRKGVLRKMFGPKRDTIIGDWSKLNSEEVHNILCLTKYNLDDQINKNGMCGACSMCGGFGRYIQGFGGEN